MGKYGSCFSNATFTNFVKQCCVGKASCSFACGNSQSEGCTCTGQKAVQTADPCFGTPKQVAGKVTCATTPSAGGATLALKVLIPPGSDARLMIPLLGVSASEVVITESGTTVFAGGEYKAGVDGITGAKVSGDAIAIAHGSGEYSFERSASIASIIH